MQISNPLLQTQIFAAIFVAALVVSIRKGKTKTFFPLEVTQELKGLAILMVIFAHIGYEIFNGSNFLFPLSTVGGVGVNIFFLLSGYGLTISALGKNDSLKTFYRKRIPKLYVPLWIVLILCLVIDAVWLRATYPVREIVYAFLGFFRKPAAM